MITEDGVIPTLGTLHEPRTSGKVDGFEGLYEKPKFEWSVATLRSFMCANSFAYSPRQNLYAHVKERDDITQMRDYYLEWINHYRSEGYRIFFQDEIWVFMNMAQNRIW